MICNQNGNWGKTYLVEIEGAAIDAELFFKGDGIRNGNMGDTNMILIAIIKVVLYLRKGWFS